ncbi:MAG: diaminopimelate decarboxylase [bacterium]
MPYLSETDGRLWLERVDLLGLANAVGTPAYVYSKAHITDAIEALNEAFEGVAFNLHYAVKANSNLAILKLCSELGTGFDIVSGGELSRVIAAGGDPRTVIFSGVGKTAEEIDFALKVGIECFNIESEAELYRIAERAEISGQVAPISIRVNPNVDAQTHPYISTGLKQNKFGVQPEQALAMYQAAAENPQLNIVGIDCHIGSQITEIEPLLDAFTNMLRLVDDLAAMGIELEHIDLGGGMGIVYQDESPLDLQTYGASVRQILGSRPQSIILEPGRSIVANAGILLTRVEYLKPASEPDAPNFAVVDAAMNDLIRPALYQAWHDILVVEPDPSTPLHQWDIVGPVCESGDFLAKDRTLGLQPSSVLAVASAGAYGMVQASNYNSRGRACEIMVDGDTFELIRRRETITDQLRLETGLDAIRGRL